MVLLPAPDIPVNQTVNPLCIGLGLFDSARSARLCMTPRVPGNLSVARDRPIRSKMYAALFLGAFFPPPASRALVLFRTGGARAGSAPDTGISPRVEGMHRHAVFTDVFLHLLRAPI